nr:hypothetical protein [Methylobacterium aquaticum]
MLHTRDVGDCSRLLLLRQLVDAIENIRQSLLGISIDRFLDATATQADAPQTPLEFLVLVLIGRS